MKKNNSQNATFVLERIKLKMGFKSDSELSEYLGIAPNTISTWKKRDSLDYKLLIEMFSDADWNEFLFGRSSQNENHHLSNSQITMSDVQAAAGLPYVFDRPRFFNELPKFSWPGETFKHGTHIAIQVNGESMEPTILHQDWLICKQLDDPIKQIKNGYVHVLVTNEGVLAKRIQNRILERGTLVCQSDNHAFSTYEEKASDVLQVYVVKAKLSFNLSPGTQAMFMRIADLELKVNQIIDKIG
jgi:hypothetical protein